MAVFTSFKDYFFYLLPMPMKKLKAAVNKWAVFGNVVGEYFDEAAENFRWVRRQTMLNTCNDGMLAVHGSERKMPRLKGESLEVYRERLKSKAEIARLAGTRRSVQLAVSSLGYDLCQIEPYYNYDEDRWAEFMVWLRASKETGINDLSLIDEKVCKVKQASSLPNYGAEKAQGITIVRSVILGQRMVPLCGTFRCGTYPPGRDEI